jgi:hypothetical protein
VILIEVRDDRVSETIVVIGVALSNSGAILRRDLATVAHARDLRLAGGTATVTSEPCGTCPGERPLLAGGIVSRCPDPTR